MYFRKYPLQMTWLDKCLKSRLAVDPSTNKMGNMSKHCCNLRKTTFTMFINHCKGNCLGKSLF